LTDAHSHLDTTQAGPGLDSGDGDLPGMAGAGASEPVDKPRPKRRRSIWGELWFMVVVGFLIVVIVKAFFVQTFYIPSGSMETTLLCNDRVLVNRLAFTGAGPSRKDVVVFRNWRDVGEDVEPKPFPRNVIGALRESVGLGNGGSEDLIKRVIALPGEEIEVRDSRAYINGEPLDEPYVFVDGPDQRADFGPVTVPPGHYFMMGDHRNNSQDSRQSADGMFVDEDAVVGRAFLRFWPPSRAGGLNGPPDQDEVRLCTGSEIRTE
jgi:signal peptidase I